MAASFLRVTEMEPTPTTGREQAINLSVHHKIMNISDNNDRWQQQSPGTERAQREGRSANIMQLTHAILVWKTMTPHRLLHFVHSANDVSNDD
jgi:hypothetical protein